MTQLVSFTTPQNVRSQAVMRRIGMTHDEADDFDHPRLPPATACDVMCCTDCDKAVTECLYRKSRFGVP